MTESAAVRNGAGSPVQEPRQGTENANSVTPGLQESETRSLSHGDVR
jgi:hypothetical protein